MEKQGGHFVTDCDVAPVRSLSHLKHEYTFLLFANSCDLEKRVYMAPILSCSFAAIHKQAATQMSDHGYIIFNLSDLL